MVALKIFGIIFALIISYIGYMRYKFFLEAKYKKECLDVGLFIIFSFLLWLFLLGLYLYKTKGHDPLNGIVTMVVAGSLLFAIIVNNYKKSNILHGTAINFICFFSTIICSIFFILIVLALLMPSETEIKKHNTIR